MAWGSSGPGGPDSGCLCGKGVLRTAHEAEPLSVPKVTPRALPGRTPPGWGWVRSFSGLGAGGPWGAKQAGPLPTAAYSPEARKVQTTRLLPGQVEGVAGAGDKGAAPGTGQQ